MRPLPKVEPPTSERVAVWTSLSDLFLDTELSEGDLCCIAEKLRQFPYAPAEIEYILRNEVTPVFGSNLLSVAGEWTAWNEEQVRAIMERWRPRRLPARWLGRLAACFYWSAIRRDWQRIKAMIE